jgi:hypothetical protein
MAKKKNKTFNKMDFFLLVDLVLIIVFTCIMIYLYVNTLSIPDTLCTCVFGVLGGELGIMGWIKSNKEKTEARKIELQDRKYYEKLNKENKGDE